MFYEVKCFSIFIISDTNGSIELIIFFNQLIDCWKMINCGVAFSEIGLFSWLDFIKNLFHSFCNICANSLYMRESRLMCFNEIIGCHLLGERDFAYVPFFFFFNPIMEIVTFWRTPISVHLGLQVWGYGCPPGEIFGWHLPVWNDRGWEGELLQGLSGQNGRLVWQ